MIRVRLAPSPTGYLHVGTAQSGLYNWLFARKNNGIFVLRIEDTDKERSKKEYEDNITESLRWLGLDWDEFYRQSERTDIYKEYLKKLLDSGKAFWCSHTKEELEEEQKVQAGRKEAPRHICNQKGADSSSKGGVIRLAVDSSSDRKIIFNDEIRGEILWEEKLIGDFVIAKDMDNSLYHFAVVADDIDMKISHVIRGEDHISNTPKQILIYEALGADIPKFAHLPLVLAPDRSKLSKRHGAVSVIDYKKDYLPKALVNFLGGLSHTFSEEIMTKEQMMEEFELSKVHKSGAIFDIKKLNWINFQYIKKLSADELRGLTGNLNIKDEFLPVITERAERLSEVDNFKYLWHEPEYQTGLLVWKKGTADSAGKALEAIKEEVSKETFDPGDEVGIKNFLDSLANDVFSGDRGAVYWPVRVALSGKDKSPDPVTLLKVLGKDESSARIGSAIAKLKDSS